MIKWTQSTGNVHNINCWTVLEELYNRYIFQQVLTYISANLIVILNLCTLIEILLKVFIRYIRLEIGREYFELTKNNYLLHEPRLVLLWLMYCYSTDINLNILLNELYWKNMQYSATTARLNPWGLLQIHFFIIIFFAWSKFHRKWNACI